MKILLCICLILVHHRALGGGGKGSKHEILKIHVPEIIKHQHHTHYVFIHKHAPKKAKEPKKKPHKHVPHMPHGHHHHFFKHWSVHGHKHHKSSHGSGHGHGHPMPHKPPPKMHKMMTHKHPKHEKKAPPAHHDNFGGYEVNEEYDEPEDTYDEPYAYYPYPPVHQPPVSSYDISPYHRLETPVQEEEEDENREGETYELGPEISYESFSYIPEKQHESFGESVPSYDQHHRHYLNEVNHGIHSVVQDDTITKFTNENNESENSDGYHHNYDDVMSH